MAGKVFVAFSEWDDHTTTFHGVFSTAKKAKAIFENAKDWEHNVSPTDSYWVAYDDTVYYTVQKTKIDDVIGYLSLMRMKPE